MPSSNLRLSSKFDSIEPGDLDVDQHQDNLTEAADSPPASSYLGLRSLVSGGVGGLCSVIVGYPFDLVKVRRQTATKGFYTSSVDTIRKAVIKDGLAKGLYAGVSIPLMGVTPMYAISFWGYDLAKLIVRRFSSDAPSSTLTIAQIYFAGFLSAIPMNIIATPFDRVKILLQTQGQTSPIDSKAPKYTGSIDAVRRLYRGGGVRSIYKGAAITFARDGLDSAAYFATYEYCKRQLSSKELGGNEGPLSLLAIGIAGAAAGIVMVIPLFPIDTVKSRLQNAENKTKVTEIVHEVYRNGGLKAFYPGVGPALVRAIPANAATLLGWELATQEIKKRFGP